MQNAIAAVVLYVMLFTHISQPAQYPMWYAEIVKKYNLHLKLKDKTSLPVDQSLDTGGSES